MPHPLRIGTRGSPLALWQANHVADRLRRRPPRRRTGRRGDSRRPVPIARWRKSAAMASSRKPSRMRYSLTESTSRCIASRTCRRRRPRTGPCRGAATTHHWRCLHLAGGVRFDELPHGAKIATGSLRREGPDSPSPAGPPDDRHPRQRRHPAAETRGGRARWPDPRRGGPATALAHVITELLDPAWMLPPWARERWASNAEPTIRPPGKRCKRSMTRQRTRRCSPSVLSCSRWAAAAWCPSGARG